MAPKSFLIRHHVKDPSLEVGRFLWCQRH